MLIERLGDDIKAPASGALARIRPVDDAALSALIRALEDEHRRVRENAAAALERIGTEQSQWYATEFYRSHPAEVCMEG